MTIPHRIEKALTPILPPSSRGNSAQLDMLDRHQPEKKEEVSK